MSMTNEELLKCIEAENSGEKIEGKEITINIKNYLTITV